jgi:hypothetical protein
MAFPSLWIGFLVLSIPVWVAEATRGGGAVAGPGLEACVALDGISSIKSISVEVLELTTVGCLLESVPKAEHVLERAVEAELDVLLSSSRVAADPRSDMTTSEDIFTIEMNEKQRLPISTQR